MSISTEYFQWHDNKFIFDKVVKVLERKRVTEMDSFLDS